MEEEVARRFKKWKNKLQQHLKHERRGCKNIINMEEKVARIFKMSRKRLQEYLKCGRRGCKNI